MLRNSIKAVILTFVNFVLFNHFVSGQILGCIDPSASNYNDKATVNDGSCLYSSQQLSSLNFVSLAKNADHLLEMSGLEKNDSLWYTHNDNPSNAFYEIHRVGDSIFQKRSIVVKGLNVVDWEEMAADSLYFYLGDFGNNVNGVRKDLKIVKVKKSFHNNLLDDSLEWVENIHFSYSDQIDFTPLSANKTDFDCEAMIVLGDSIFLFSKQWQSLNTLIYRLAKTGDNQVAEKITEIPINGLVTGAKLSPDKKKLALVGYSNLLQPFVCCVYGFQKNDYQFGCIRKLNVNMPFYQMEGICWENDSIVSVVNEKFVNAFVQTNPAMQQYNLGFCWEKLYRNQLGVGKFEEMNLKLRVLPNPIQQNETLKLILEGANRCLPVREEIYVSNMKGQKLMTIQMTSDHIELNHLVPGEYVIGSQKVGFVTISVI